MKLEDGFVQVYNAGVALDAYAQIILGQDLMQSFANCGQLVPMIDAVEANLGGKPEQPKPDGLFRYMKTERSHDSICFLKKCRE